MKRYFSLILVLSIYAFGMKVPVDTIGTHTGTGASSVSHQLGDDGFSGSASRVANPTRHIHVTGIAGGSVVKIQGSMDGSNWVDWITGISADGWYIIVDGPRYIRSNCTTYGSGTVTVKAQKFVED